MNAPTPSVPTRAVPQEPDNVPERIIDLARAFTSAIIADEALAWHVPPDVHLSLIPEDDPEVAARVVRLGMAAVERGENVYFLHVQRQPDGALTVKYGGDISKEGPSDDHGNRAGHGLHDRDLTLVRSS